MICEYPRGTRGTRVPRTREDPQLAEGPTTREDPACWVRELERVQLAGPEYSRGSRALARGPSTREHQRFSADASTGRPLAAVPSLRLTLRAGSRRLGVVPAGLQAGRSW